MKTIEYKAKGYNGEKVDVPAKYARAAKGLIKDVLELKDEVGLSNILNKYDYEGRDIYDSVRELFSYKSTYNDFSSPSKKLKLQELKDNVYLRVCAYGTDKMNTKKVKKVRKKSEEEVLRINKKNSKIMERMKKILRDD
jgi:uncharacterized protein YutD